MYSFYVIEGFHFWFKCLKVELIGSHGKHKFSFVRNWNCYTLFCAAVQFYIFIRNVLVIDRIFCTLFSIVIVTIFLVTYIRSNISLWFLIYISLMANDTEYFPMCLCLLWWNDFSYLFLTFQLYCFVFILLSFISFFILYMYSRCKIFYEYVVYKCYLPLYSLFFILFIRSFTVKKF